MYKIEKDIPYPAPRARYPLDKMEIGDSFEAPRSESGRIRGAIVQFHNSIHYRAARKGIVFSMRTIDNDTCRVWRMSNREVD